MRCFYHTFYFKSWKLKNSSDTNSNEVKQINTACADAASFDSQLESEIVMISII